MKDKDGQTYLIDSLSIKFGMVDFSNNEAREWAKNVIKDNMITEASAIGWMCDFGEWFHP